MLTLLSSVYISSTRPGPSRRMLGSADSAQSDTDAATVPALVVRRPLTPAVPSTCITRLGTVAATSEWQLLLTFSSEKLL